MRTRATAREDDSAAALAAFGTLGGVPASALLLGHLADGERAVADLLLDLLELLLAALGIALTLAARGHGSDRLDVDGFGAFFPRLGVEAHALAVVERAKALPHDAGVMDERILPALIGRDEAEALVVAEPLDGSGCHRSLLPTGCTGPFARPDSYF